MASNAEMVDYIWPISTNYVFGGSRYEPYDTDCSGMVCAAFWHVHGVDPYTLGDCTGAQWNNGLLTQIWWGQTPYLPWEIMQKGDVIFTSTVAPSFDTGQGSHVGFYTGDPDAPFLSHFANGGPYVTAVNGVYGGNEKYYGVARYVPGSEDEVSASEVWGYKNTSMTNIDAYQELFDIHKQLTRTDNAGWASPKGHDLFGRVNSMQVDLAQIKKDIANLKAGGATIDYDKLANAVADKIAARMKS